MNQSRDTPHPADWTELALHAGGRSLIEASAGTGKTWTISLLYLRLLLENGLSPTQVIVTTFTDAAAQELRERIRARLLWAEQQAQSPGGTDDDDVRWLQSRWRRDGVHEPARTRADLMRLRLAASELDRAPIGTLHSLCRRILADHPFESGCAFELGAPLLPDAINAELCADLWRRLGEAAGALADADRLWWQAGRALLDRNLRAVLAPGVGVAVSAVPALEPVMQPANARLLADCVADGAKFTRANSKLRSRLGTLAKFILAGDPCAPPPDLDEVLAEPPERHLRPHALRDEHCLRALAIARAAATLLPQFVDALRAQALARYRDELRQRRRRTLIERGAITFDDLLERVDDALTGSGGAALAQTLFAAWPVALVDEFQDTDALQYAILDRIYRDDRGLPRGRLVMIGDPKQAIYRFRGGDIGAYLAARAAATSMLPLAVNFRASRQLVAAQNAFFQRAGERLSSDPAHAIAYAPVRASAVRETQPYLIDGFVCEQPLQFHCWDGADVPGDNDGRVAAALAACANHVVELLSGRHAIGDRIVQPGDIAVLLPTARQIAQLRAHLRERDVPCVATAWSSVFASDWARELQVVLYAALHPRDDAAVRAALATRLYARGYAELRALCELPDAWQRETEAFEELDRIWRTQGVLAAIQQMTRSAAARLFASGDGERNLTDLRHLGELLQARSEEVAGREELLTWLAGERRRAAAEGGDAGTDERQQRIESDARRVRLLTLHASKGLEFSIVLLPLMWMNRHNPQDTTTIVHDAASGQRVVAFGSAARARYLQDGQDERFRLLYVALTRARYACHVYALAPDRPSSAGKRAETDPQRAPLDALLERVRAHAEPASTIAHVAWKCGPWTWPYAAYAPAQGTVGGARHVLRAPPPTAFETTWSFSALVQGTQAAVIDDQPASDEAPAPLADEAGSEGLAAGEEAQRLLEPAAPAPEPEHAELAWLAPVAGPDFGNAVHAIFERRVPGVPLRNQHALVERCLLEHGVGLRGMRLDELVPRLAARIQATLEAPLDAADAALTLGALPAAALCAEMPFEFALGAVSLERLRAVCNFVPPGPWRTLRGLMSGKIDLVFEHAGRFHVVDYKSNRLGTATRLSDYAPAQLERTMADDHYRFQALLYTVALDRYLRQRVTGYRRATQLGAAIYLFVRAVGIAPDAAPRAGIWSHRFDDALIEAVDAALAGDGGHAA